jgi:hypothetical protein
VSSVALLLQAEPNCFTSYNTSKGLGSVSLCAIVLRSSPFSHVSTCNRQRSWQLFCVHYMTTEGGRVKHWQGCQSESQYDTSVPTEFQWRTNEITCIQLRPGPIASNWTSERILGVILLYRANVSSVPDSFLNLLYTTKSFVVCPLYLALLGLACKEESRLRAQRRSWWEDNIVCWRFRCHNNRSSLELLDVCRLFCWRELCVNYIKIRMPYRDTVLLPSHVSFVRLISDSCRYWYDTKNCRLSG